MNKNERTALDTGKSQLMSDFLLRHGELSKTQRILVLRAFDAALAYAETRRAGMLGYLAARLLSKCPHCMVKAGDACPYGHPGCARVDDMMFETAELKEWADWLIRYQNTERETRHEERVRESLYQKGVVLV